MTTWEERVAHLSERWATSSRPHRNPPPLPSFRRKPETTRPRRHPPPRPPQQTNPTPKITQIKRITVEAALVAAHAPPNPPSHPRAPHPSFRRKPESTQPQLPGTARQHQPKLQLPPLPSFQRKPETTQPQLPGTARQHQPNCSSPPTVFPAKAGIHVPPTLKTPSPLQPNGNSHPSRHSNEIRNEARGNVR